MKVTILGAAQAGQQELFSIITKIPLSQIQLKPTEVQLGICDIADPRMAKLIKMFNPKKVAYAKIEYALLPDFNMSGPTKDLILGQLRNADELCFVTQSDILEFISELVIYDMMLAEKRLENIEKEQRKKVLDSREKEKQLILKCKVQLEEERLLQKLEFDNEQMKLIRTYQFLTMKPIFIVLNTEGDQKVDLSGYDLPNIKINAKLEEEINQLDEKDREPFMKEIGIEEPALHKMTRMAFAGLGMMTFFTVGEDEVRSWPVKIGATAPEAGSAIHSDIEKGFVRAEMCKFDDLMDAGSEAKLKEIGKFYLKGRDYILEDGDILSFRFNV